VRIAQLLPVLLLVAGACDRPAVGDGADGGGTAPDAGSDDLDTETGPPFTGWDACVYVFTGWYTKADECWGGVHATADLIQLAEEFCADNWDELCDLDAPSDQDLAYDCRFAIKVANCEDWESGVWFEDDACAELTAGIDCDFATE
jgi:hypothetical protein